MLSLDDVLRLCAFMGFFAYMMQVCTFFILLKILHVLKKQGKPINEDDI